MADRYVTLTGTTIGTDISTVDIYHSSVTPSNLIVSGVTRAALLTGYTFLDDSSHDIYIIDSDSPCDVETTVNIEVSPTPTPSITPTTSVTPSITPTNSVAAPPLGAVNIYTSDKKSKSDIANANLFGATANDPEETFYFRMYEDTANQDPNGNNLIYLLINGGGLVEAQLINVLKCKYHLLFTELILCMFLKLSLLMLYQMFGMKTVNHLI